MTSATNGMQSVQYAFYAALEAFVLLFTTKQRHQATIFCYFIKKSKIDVADESKNIPEVLSIVSLNEIIHSKFYKVN